MNIVNNNEIKILKEKADYIKLRHKNIEWTPTEPDCLHEFKSINTYNENDANDILNVILANEYTENQSAIAVYPSRKIASAWRIVINLERISKWR